MQQTRPFRAFTLLEVILAIGLFAGSVTVIIAMLPALSREASAAGDRHMTQRLPDALRVELARLANTGLDSLAAQIPEMDGPLRNGLGVVADRDGARVQSLSYLPPGSGRIPEDQQYFLLECWKYPDEPLRFDHQKAFLAVVVQVSWPYRLPGLEASTAESSRHKILFTVTLTR